MKSKILLAMLAALGLNQAHAQQLITFGESTWLMGYTTQHFMLGGGTNPIAQTLSAEVRMSADFLNFYHDFSQPIKDCQNSEFHRCGEHLALSFISRTRPYPNNNGKVNEPGGGIGFILGDLPDCAINVPALPPDTQRIWLALEQFADVDPALSQVPICVPLTKSDFPVSSVPGFSREFKFNSYVVADAVWSPSTVRRAYISVQLRRIDNNGLIGSANSLVYLPIANVSPSANAWIAVTNLRGKGVPPPAGIQFLVTESSTSQPEVQ